MRRNEFKRYLTTKKGANDKPFAESTAKETVALCSSIEKEFGMDLDDALQAATEETRLFSFVDGIKRADSKKYRRAIYHYSDFFKTTSSLLKWNHFSYYPDAVLDGIDIDLLGKMEGEYECILGFGRDEFFGEACKKPIERIPVILSPEIRKRTYKRSDAEIAKQICDLFKQQDGNVTEQEIMAILQQSKTVITHKILGEFIKADKPYIILYYKAIGGKTREEKVAGLANVLAHEYMHYMEYRYCLSKGVASSENEKLSEAMADFFGVLHILKYKYYAAREKETVAEDRYNAWKRYFGSSWPYAEALHFYSVDDITMGFSTEYSDYDNFGSVEKLRKVFCESYDPDIAYNTLLQN